MTNSSFDPISQTLLRMDIVLGSIEYAFSSLDFVGMMFKVLSAFVPGTFNPYTQYDMGSKYQVVTPVVRSFLYFEA